MKRQARRQGSPLLSQQHWHRLRCWHRAYGRHDLPWRVASTGWSVLLAETLLRRTRADVVAKIFPHVAVIFPSPRSVLEQRDRWMEAVRPAGLGWRAELFVQCCKQLCERHSGVVPESPEELLSLPGVGHYVASAVMCFGFGRPAVLVDANTLRLARRIAGMSAVPHHRSAAARELVARLGPGGSPPAPQDNYALLDLAALVCRPRDPLCERCPVLGACVTGYRRISGAPLK